MPRLQAATARSGSRSLPPVGKHCVSELMQGHDQEQRQILHDVPAYRRVPCVPALDFIDRYQKPGPMQKYVHAGETKQPD